ncbi:MAG TPA: spermidine/putrescine ABC transporter substrate-binding protein [Mycobacteriales bacterium]|nr:spermidine/putrescine ABC transporter substrate-binding protein [Mycobacteriales bacterium]
MADRSHDEDLDLVLRLNERLLSRRSLLRGIGMGGAVAMSGGILAGCGTSGGKAKNSQKTVPDLSATDKRVIWSNWPLYIDVNDKTKAHPTIDAFEKQTGIKVTYIEDVNDNDEFFGKIRPELAAGKATGRDIVTLTDWMAARMIRLNYVEKLDKANIPNAKNLKSALQHPGFDQNRDYTMPWQSGLTGVAYNPKATGGKPVTSVHQLLTDPSLKGKVTALTEMRDTMGLILLDMGKDPANFTDTDFQNAIDVLKKAVSDGQIRKFTGNDYAQGLANGNIAACLAWSGDVVQLQPDNPGIKLVLPDAGCMIWSDNLMIPNKASHKTNAEKLINYYYDPTVAAQVAAYVNYICPVDGAKQAMEKIDKTLVDNPLIFPDDATLAKTHIFKTLDGPTETKYNNMFTAVTGA